MLSTNSLLAKWPEPLIPKISSLNSLLNDRVYPFLGAWRNALLLPNLFIKAFLNLTGSAYFDALLRIHPSAMSLMMKF